MKTYKELDVWRSSVELSLEIYRITTEFPDTEKFGLVSQMRRCSVSVPSNIAEGYARENRRENAHFVSIAFGSASELETQLILAKKLGFIVENQHKNIEEKLRKVLSMLCIPIGVI